MGWRHVAGWSSTDAGAGGQAALGKQAELAAYPLVQPQLVLQPPDGGAGGGVELDHVGRPGFGERGVEAGSRSEHAVLGGLETGDVVAAQADLDVALVTDQLAEGVGAGRQRAEGLGQVAEHVARGVLVQPVAVGGFGHRAHQAADRHRRVLECLEALPEAGLDVRRTDGTHVETPPFLRPEQRGTDDRDVVGDAPGVVEPLPGGTGQALRVSLGHGVELAGRPDQELADRVGQPVDRAAGVGAGDLRREDERGDDAHRCAHQGLGDPLPRRRLRADRSHARGRAWR